MKVTVDTNVLVRAVVFDELQQAAIADQVLTTADMVCIGNSSLCELVWVLGRYAFKHEAVAAAIRALLGSANVQMDRAAVEFGLSFLEAGGDFADGLIAFEGEALGGETFVSFDKKAVGLLAEQGVRTRLL